MGIALFTASKLFSPLQALAAWLLPTARQATCARRHVAVRQTSDAAHAHQDRVAVRHHAAASHAMVSHPMVSVSTVRRPLRVLRVVERNAAPASAGRMLISGRMADVCAELDRLAAKEAAQHCA